MVRILIEGKIDFLPELFYLAFLQWADETFESARIFRTSFAREAGIC